MSLVSRVLRFIADVVGKGEALAASVAQEGDETVIRLRQPAPARAGKPAGKPTKKPSRGRPPKATENAQPEPPSGASEEGSRFDTLAFIAAHPGSTREEIVAAARASGMRSTGPVVSSLARMTKSGSLIERAGTYSVASESEREAA